MDSSWIIGHTLSEPGAPTLLTGSPCAPQPRAHQHAGCSATGARGRTSTNASVICSRRCLELCLQRQGCFLKQTRASKRLAVAAPCFAGTHKLNLAHSARSRLHSHDLVPVSSGSVALLQCTQQVNTGAHFGWLHKGAMARLALKVLLLVALFTCVEGMRRLSAPRAPTSASTADPSCLPLDASSHSMPVRGAV